MVIIQDVSIYLPEKTLTNNDFHALGIETDNEWIVSRTGIHSRRICSELESVSSIGIKACEGLSFKKEDIGVLIIATSTHDKSFPSAAVYVHAALGLPKQCIAFDLYDACNGFVQAFSVAMHYIKNTKKKAIVVGAEKMSSIVDWSDRGTCILFGDGAGAVLLSGEDVTLYDESSNTLSEHKDELLANPKISMNGNKVFKFAVTCIAQDATEILQRNNLSPRDVDFFVPHQANTRILDAVAKQVDFKEGTCVNVLKDIGNISAATIPVALYSIKDKLTKDKIILMTGFAAGFRYGSVLIRN